MTEVGGQQSDVYAKLARKLAHVDKEVRMAGLDNVRSFLRTKRGLPHDEMMKLWSGLFYCMWHSDKPLVQQELARSLSGLVHDIGWRDAVSFYACFAETMCRKWQGIDRLRLDKYYDLLRCMSQDVLKLLSTRRWEAEVVSAFLEQMDAQVLHGATLAVTLHQIDYWVTDLTDAGCPKPDVLLEPMLRLLSTTSNDVVIQRLLENVIGKVDSLPALNVAEFGKRCFAIGADPATAQRNRKALYKAHRQLCGEIVGDEVSLPAAPLAEAQQPKAKKRKPIKIARALEIDDVVPHTPLVAPIVEESQQPQQAKPKKRKNKKQKADAQVQQLQQQGVPVGQAEMLQQKLQKLKRPHQSAAAPQPSVVRQKRENNNAEHDVAAVAVKRAKPAPAAVEMAPSPPRMLQLKRAPSSEGRRVQFALHKNEVIEFQKAPKEKGRRFSIV
jgi:ribosomal RNA-processing protein 1